MTPVLADARCSMCGGGLRLLEPLAVECGWCDASNRRDQTDACTACGGPLPALPGGNPGPRPADCPRTLPPNYENRIRYWKNVNVLIGLIFTLCFWWTLIFAAVGIPLWIKGRNSAERKLAALRNGIPTRGRITSVAVDTTQHINNRNPWRIEYTFDLPNGTFHGFATAWDPSSARRSTGDVLWIVAVPSDPAINAIWPPIH